MAPGDDREWLFEPRMRGKFRKSSVQFSGSERRRFVAVNAIEAWWLERKLMAPSLSCGGRRYRWRKWAGRLLTGRRCHADHRFGSPTIKMHRRITGRRSPGPVSQDGCPAWWWSPPSDRSAIRLFSIGAESGVGARSHFRQRSVGVQLSYCQPCVTPARVVQNSTAVAVRGCGDCRLSFLPWSVASSQKLTVAPELVVSLRQ